MGKILSIIAIAAISLSSCKKDLQIDPKASFTINGDSSQSYTLATYDGLMVNNLSSNAVSYTWDLGNGTFYNTYGTKDLGLYYPKSGQYTLTLTAIDKDGKKSVARKNIKVLDRVLRQIAIPSIYFNTALAFSNTTYPPGKANVWVEIQQAEPGRTASDYIQLPNGSRNIPVIYKSPLALNIDQGSVPITLNVDQRLVIDWSTLKQSRGSGYTFNLFAQDATGTYLLMSTLGSGVSISAYGSLRDNKFTVTTGFEGSQIHLICDYE